MNGFARDHGHTDAAIGCVWASISIGCLAMLRKDNISSGKAGTFDLHHCILRGDMIFIPQTQALWLRCRFGKTNQFRERAHIVPLQYTGGKLCPVLAYNAHLVDFPSDSELQPAFIVVNVRRCHIHS